MDSLASRINGRCLAAVASLALAVPAGSAQRGTPPAPCKYEQNCHCAAPGITIRWKAAYCMIVNETDDPENAGVTACLDRRDPASLRRRDACAQNAHWKQKWCEVRFGKDRAGVRQCVQDKAMIPPFVETGAGR